MRNEKMKIVIAYDGSDCAKQACDDLSRAGLPLYAEATVLSVGDTLFPSPPPSSYEIVGTALASRRVTLTIVQAKRASAKALDEAKNLSREGADRLLSNFPEWDVLAKAVTGEPATEVTRYAEQSGADLIVVGSLGRSALGRLILGSVSKRVVTESRSSVRVARCKSQKDAPPIKLIIGFDASPESRLAVRTVALRRWPAGTLVRIITANSLARPQGLAALLPTTTSRFAVPVNDELANIDEHIESAADDLRAGAGLNVMP